MFHMYYFILPNMKIVKLTECHNYNIYIPNLLLTKDIFAIHTFMQHIFHKYLVLLLYVRIKARLFKFDTVHDRVPIKVQSQSLS